MGGVRLTLRVFLKTNRTIGTDNLFLLHSLNNTLSISQAGRSLGMSCRRAWLLVDDTNRCFRELVVNAQPGASQGGGAALTAFGEKVVQKYRTIETAATAATKPQLHDLEASLRSSKRGAIKARKTSIRASTAR